MGPLGFAGGARVVSSEGPGQSQGCFRGGRAQLRPLLAQLVSRTDWQARKGHTERLLRVQV